MLKANCHKFTFCLIVPTLIFLSQTLTSILILTMPRAGKNFATRSGSPSNLCNLNYRQISVLKENIRYMFPVCKYVPFYLNKSLEFYQPCSAFTNFALICVVHILSKKKTTFYYRM